MDSVRATPASPDRLVRLPEVMQRTGMSRSWIYNEVRQRRFPAPVRVGGRAVAWLDADLARWLADVASRGSAIC